MAAVYRYLAPKHAASMMAMGTVRIGALHSFAALESALADDLDGGVVLRPDPLGLNVTGADAAAMAKFSIAVVGADTQFTIFGGEISNRVTGHALCCCLRPDNKHLLQQHAAVVEIADPVAFVQELTRAANGRLGHRFEGGLVRYDQREWTDLANVQEANAFVKKPGFAAEEEYRLFWPDSPTDEAVMVTAPSLTRWLRRVA